MKNRLWVLLSFPLLLASCGGPYAPASSASQGSISSQETVSGQEGTSTQEEATSKTYTFYKGADYDIFHSYFTWTFDSDDGDYGQDIDDYLVNLNKISDPYVSYKGVTNLYTLNQTSDPVVVSDELFNLLKAAVDLYEKTEHYFNPLLGKITKLWKATLFGDEDSVDEYSPSAEDIKAAKSQVPALLEEVNSSSLVFDEENKTVTRVGDATIDLGGLVKGYAVEGVETILAAHRASRYLLNGGQSSLGLGKSQAGNNFRVSLMYSETSGENRYSLGDVDSSTSAIYEQFIIVDGKYYSHVINPLTGMPQTPYSMAFLVGQESATLDAFSTSCMIAGPEKAAEWGQKYGFDYALFTNNGGYTKLASESEALTKARI